MCIVIPGVVSLQESHWLTASFWLYFVNLWYLSSWSVNRSGDWPLTALFRDLLSRKLELINLCTLHIKDYRTQPVPSTFEDIPPILIKKENKALLILMINEKLLTHTFNSISQFPRVLFIQQKQGPTYFCWDCCCMLKGFASIRNDLSLTALKIFLLHGLKTFLH